MIKSVVVATLSFFIVGKGLNHFVENENHPELGIMSALTSEIANEPQIGEVAPDIVLKDEKGKPLPLSSLKGKVVLIDFWASWCGPCRRENPNVVQAYQKYKDKGFTVYSVSLDSNKESWLKAIKQDGMDWHHVSDLKSWKSKAAATYKIRSIPATYLIDANGKIIGKNLRGESLEQTLNLVFKDYK